jgi:hypothetical protein
MELPPGPARVFRTVGNPHAGFDHCRLSSGSFAISGLVHDQAGVRLRAATQQLAAGDLTARAGNPQQQKAR